MKFIISLILIAGTVSSGMAQQISLNKKSGIGLEDRRTPSAGTFAISYDLASINQQISGLQFDIKFDPTRFQPASLDSCLEGVPGSHKGEFSTCNVIEDKNMVRVIIMDLGRNRPLPDDTVLGWVEFDRIGPASTGIEEPKITDVLYAGKDGKQTQPSVAGGTVLQSTLVDFE